MGSPHRLYAAVGLAVLALALSGCGGAGSSSNSSDSPPPDNPAPNLIPLSVGTERRFTASPGPAFYQFTTGDPGVYAIRLDSRLNGQTGSDFSDMFWLLYASLSFTNPLLTCDDFKSGVAKEECVLTLEGSTSYYFLINHFASLGDEYALAVSYGGPVAAGDGAGVGEPGAPVDPPTTVLIAPGRPAYLKLVQDGTGNVQIAATPQGANADFSNVSWSINSDINFPQDDHIFKRCSRRQGAYAETCSFSGLPAGEWYLQVDQHTDLPVDVALSITNYGERVDEGSLDAPVPLALNTPRLSQVGSVGISVYQFTTTVAGGYLVTLANPHDALGFDLADAAGDPLPVGGFGFVDPAHGIDRGAFANLEAGATYTLRVFEMHGAGSDFTLEVTSP